MLLLLRLGFARALCLALPQAFEVETWDASTGYFKSPEDKAIPARRPGFDRSPPLANPIGGPVWLEGAERGDTIVVTVEDIVVDDYSWIAVGPRRGPLGESTRWPELSRDYTTKVFKHTPGPSGTTTPSVQPLMPRHTFWQRSSLSTSKHLIANSRCRSNAAYSTQPSTGQL